MIDTGDVVDWGTPAEEALPGQIGELGVPYVYVKGNHDSDGIARAVARQPNATVLDGHTEPVAVAGVTFVGMPDPRFTPDKTTGDDHAGHRVTAAAEAFAGALRSAGTAAPTSRSCTRRRGGRKLAGIVPLVLCGDTHIRAARRFGDTVVLTQGTSGGSGLRGVQAEPTTPARAVGALPRPREQAAVGHGRDHARRPGQRRAVGRPPPAGRAARRE